MKKTRFIKAEFSAFLNHQINAAQLLYVPCYLNKAFGANCVKQNVKKTHLIKFSAIEQNLLNVFLFNV